MHLSGRGKTRNTLQMGFPRGGRALASCKWASPGEERRWQVQTVFLRRGEVLAGWRRSSSQGERRLRVANGLPPRGDGACGLQTLLPRASWEPATARSQGIEIPPKELPVSPPCHRHPAPEPQRGA